MMKLNVEQIAWAMSLAASQAIGIARPQAYPVYGQMEGTNTALVNGGSNKY